MGGFQDDCGAGRRIFPGGDCEGCGDERRLWDSVANEGNRLAGTPVKMYVLRRAKNRDPIYGEPSRDGKEWSFEGPFEVMGSVEYTERDDNETEATEAGIQKTKSATLWIARVEFEDKGAPYPKKGDVAVFWGQPPFAEPAEEQQWDVVSVEPDGHLFSAEAFVQYRINVKQRTKFYAFRKVEHSRA
jgi:hypothetical protein